MRAISPPSMAFDELLNACQSELMPTEQLAVSEHHEAIKRQAAEFGILAAGERLATLLPLSIGAPVDSALKKMYKCLTSRSRLRRFYDRLRACVAGYCPYCGLSEVGSLDHFLPKEAWPELSVAPHNLVPACDRCNRYKLSWTPTSTSNVLFNPYFDDWHAFGVDLVKASIEWTTAPGSLHDFCVTSSPAHRPTTA